MSGGGLRRRLVLPLSALGLGAVVACSRSAPPPIAPTLTEPTASPSPAETPIPTPTLAAATNDTEARLLLSAAVTAADEGLDDRSLGLVVAAVAAAPAGTPAAQAAHFLLGRRLLDEGAMTTAVLHLEAARAITGPLDFHVAAALAVALAGSGDEEAARSLRRALLADPMTPPDVRDAVISASAPSATPRDAEALALLANRPEALAATLRVMADGGSKEALAAGIQRLVGSFPASLEALEALALARTLGIAVDPGIAGRALYRNGKLEEAIALLSQATEDPTAGAQSLVLRRYYLAAAIDDSGRARESVAHYDAVRALWPEDPLAYRASYWAARALETAGDAAEASTRYVALANDHPSGQFAAEAAFRAGFAWLEGGDPTLAIATWDRVGVAADARVLYWKGRALESAGRPAEARTAFEAAAGDWSTFYGEEARRRLAGSATPWPGFAPVAPRPASQWEDVEGWFARRTGLPPPGWEPRTAAGVLSSLGLREDARRSVEAAAVQADDPGRLLGLVREADEAGLSRTAIAILEDILAVHPTPYTELPRSLQAVLYPIPLPALLQSSAVSFGLDPLFLAALVRQESHWDPAAISFAGALGLTQVMPATGSQVAVALGHDGFAPSDLLRPAVSLKFGAYYIAAQLSRFGAPAAALAAYNGGPGNAQRWAAIADPGSDPARYLEAITFSETHGYVESVLTGYVRYRALAPR